MTAGIFRPHARQALPTCILTGDFVLGASMSRQLDSLSHRVLDEGDGTFSVHVLTAQLTRVVPGFPSPDEAQEWIASELDRRERSAEREKKLRW
jgi:hypothetical protein